MAYLHGLQPALGSHPCVALSSAGALLSGSSELQISDRNLIGIELD